MNYKITRKLVLFIVSLLLLFSLLMSVVFARLFSEHTLEYHQEDLKIRAEAIASNLTEFLNSTSSSGSMGMGGMGMGMNGMKGYMPYLRGLEQVAMGNIWIVDRNASIIYESKGLEIESQELPSSANEIIEKALSGSTSFSETFSDFIGIKSLTVGVPILNDTQEVIGAVLLHAPVNNIDSSILSGLNILFISAAIALVLAILLGTLFSLKFIAPIKKINKAAYKLSEGDYSIQTQVIQDDEIGDLAKTVDQLAIRLDEASKESSRLEQSRRD
ncbi:HAMP domain-containing protein, partial [Proteiniclasticum ruminis]|uniref:HAMP domain-containing protein n=1 Tax=Proteiniclasticum ruminis TaxID=398199 RepID=UPI0028AF6C8D